MNNQKQLISIIKSLSGQANILSIPRVFISIFDGDIHAALFLNQLVYWSDKGKNGEGWIYKSYDEWDKEIGLSAYQVKRCVEKLEALGLLETKLKRANGAPTLHYLLDFGKLINSINELLDNQETSQSDYEETKESDTKETSQSLTETTQRITQETTKAEEAAVPELLTEGQKRFLSALGAKRFKTNLQKTAVLELERKHGTDKLIEFVTWASKRGMGLGDAVVSAEKALPKWGQARAGTNGNGKANGKLNEDAGQVYKG